MMDSKAACAISMASAGGEGSITISRSSAVASRNADIMIFPISIAALWSISLISRSASVVPSIWFVSRTMVSWGMLTTIYPPSATSPWIWKTTMADISLPM